MQKIVMYGLLVENKEHLKDLEDGFQELGFGKPKLIGQFETLPGEGGEGGRSDVVLEVEDKYVSKMALHPMHLGGGFSWAGDYVNNHKEIIPVEAHKFFDKEIETNKPVCKLVGEDGNVFNIIGRVSKTLKRAGSNEKANEFTKKALSSGSYGEVLRLAEEYVEVE